MYDWMGEWMGQERDNTHCHNAVRLEYHRNQEMSRVRHGFTFSAACVGCRATGWHLDPKNRRMPKIKRDDVGEKLI